MPIPKPTQNEKKDKDGEQKFISRCMADPVMRKDYKDQKQRAAVCYSQLKQKKKKKGSVSEADWDEVLKNGYLLVE